MDTFSQVEDITKRSKNTFVPHPLFDYVSSYLAGNTYAEYKNIFELYISYGFHFWKEDKVGNSFLSLIQKYCINPKHKYVLEELIDILKKMQESQQITQDSNGEINFYFWVFTYLWNIFISKNKLFHSVNTNLTHFHLKYETL